MATACDLSVAADDAKCSDHTVRWNGAHVQYASLPWEVGCRIARQRSQDRDLVQTRVLALPCVSHAL